MNTQDASPLPLYHRVYLLLRQRIVEGTWPSDRAMPGEHELAASHAVSRITVRSALQRLEAEGLVVRRRGAGTFVLRPPAEKRRDTLRGAMEDLHEMGVHTQVRLLGFETVQAPETVASRLGVPPDSPVQKSVRVRQIRGTPLSHLTAWVPEEIGRTYRREDLAARPMLTLLAAAGFHAVRADQTISARLADGQEAQRLKVDPGSALLWVRRVVWDGAGRAIEALDALYRPDVYEYQVAMARTGETWCPASADTPP